MLRQTWLRRSLAVLGALIVLLGLIEVVGGSYAKRRAVEAAARQGFAIDVGSARIGLLSVVLKNIEGGLQGDDAVHLHFDSVHVSLTTGMKVEAVKVVGGSLTATGSASHLRDALRARHGSGGGDEPPGSGATLHAEELRAEWRDGQESVVLSGMKASRERGVFTIQVLETTMASPLASARVVGARATTERGAGASTLVTAEKVELIVRTEAVKARRDGEGHDAQGRGVSGDSSAPLFPFARIKSLRTTFDAGAAMMVAKIPAPFEAKIDAAELTLQGGGDKDDRAIFGPGPLGLTRTEAQLTATYTSLPTAGSTPLSLALAIPVNRQGVVGDVRVHLDGGPVSGKLFGLREGVFGLTDLDRTKLEGRADLVWTEGGSSLSFDGHLNAKGLGIVQPRLSREPISGLDVGIRGRGLATAVGELRLDELEASLGMLRVQLRGSVQEDSRGLRANLGFNAPLAGCGALLDSVPLALRPTLRGATLSGTLGASGRLTFDSTQLDTFVLEYDVRDSCRFTAVPEGLSREKYMRAFSHRIYRADGTLGEELTGPGTEHWTPLDKISPFMQVAVLTTEDGSFRRHRGFNHRAIRDALVANLKARRFLRGASTITMQLAKNLFLSREKTLARKLEEIILTDYLEQTWDKDEMLELYLNVIEFGPDVYGITKAAEYYFGRKPEELNLAECMFLASVLPSPLRLGKSREKGELTAHQRGLIDTLMRIAFKTGKVSHSELAEGISSPITFVKAGAPRPTPRPPAHGSRFEEPDSDPAWEPIQGPARPD